MSPLGSPHVGPIRLDDRGPGAEYRYAAEQEDAERGLLRHSPTERLHTTADHLGTSPKVTVIQVIEVRFHRGKGLDERDPFREVVALFRDDGTPIVEIDPCMADS